MPAENRTTMRKIALVVLALAAVTIAAQAAKPDKKARAARQELAVKERLDSRDFRIDVRRAMPMGGRTVSLSSSYSVKIKGDSVYSFLPYFGRAYSLPYGGGDGLIFDGVMTDYESGPGKKGATDITFGVRTPEDTFRYRIEVFDNGTSYISVMSNNRQEISFQGDLRTGVPERKSGPKE